MDRPKTVLKQSLIAVIDNHSSVDAGHLLATTMLACTASVAVAEVALSGDARMGIINGHVLGAGADDTTFTSRARVTFGLSGESDSGLSFGGSFRADNAPAAANGTAGSVFVKAGGLTVSMGDVDGAANAAVGHVDGVGLTGLGDLNENIFIANGGLGGDVADQVGLADQTLTGDPSLLIAYSIGGLSVYGSATQPGHTFADGFAKGVAYAVGASYAIDAYTVSIGYESLGIDEVGGPGSLDIKHMIIGGDATFGQVTLKARYGNGDIDENGVAVADITQAALSATYAVDAVSLTGFVSQKSIEDQAGANMLSVDAMGVGMSYDLGGGASVVGGISKLEIQEGAARAQNDTAFDFGMSFSF